jgi:hypothetical protein
MISAEVDAKFWCAYCGRENDLLIDVSAGLHQQFVEDCTVCCRPNVVRVWIDSGTGDVAVESGADA